MKHRNILTKCRYIPVFVSFASFMLASFLFAIPIFIGGGAARPINTYLSALIAFLIIGICAIISVWWKWVFHLIIPLTIIELLIFGFLPADVNQLSRPSNQWSSISINFLILLPFIIYYLVILIIIIVRQIKKPAMKEKQDTVR